MSAGTAGTFFANMHVSPAGRGTCCGSDDQNESLADRGGRFDPAQPAALPWSPWTSTAY